MESTTVGMDGTLERAILFDLDGTLVDSTALARTCTQEVLQRAVSLAAYHEGTRFTTPERLGRLMGLDPEDEDYAAITSARAGAFDAKMVERVSSGSCPAFPLMLPLVRSLGQHASLAILTNAAVAYARAVTRVHGLEVSLVHGADDVPRPKPHPEGLLMCASELECQAKNCVYVGDSPSDGDAARAAGMLSVGVGWGAHARATLEGSFNVVVDTVLELARVLVAFATSGALVTRVPAHVLCIRHGERTDHADACYSAGLARPQDMPITDRGMDQALALGRYLRAFAPFSECVILTSPLIRCVQTADGIATGLGVSPREKMICVEEGLAESDTWLRNPALKADRALADLGPVFLRANDLACTSARLLRVYRSTYRVLLDPSWQEDVPILARCKLAAAMIMARADLAGKTVLLVSHGGPTRLWVDVLTGEDHGKSRNYTGISHLVPREDGGWQLVNEAHSTPHLSEVASSEGKF